MPKVIDVSIAAYGLDTKTKQLIYIAMKIITDDENAVNFYVPMAKAAGASREEIKSTILLSITVNGLKGVSQFLPQALKIYDNH